MNIMAIFAHPDDEIGCIGTLAKHAARGDKIMLVWTTLGELASQFGNTSHEEVTRVRREHGAWVAERIGADYRFFDMGDSRMTGERDESLQLARLYAEFKPDVLITWSEDHPHPDHRMSAKISYDAITLARIPKIINEGRGESEQLTPWRSPVRQYLYYAPASNYPEVFVDIEGTIDAATDVMGYYHAFYKWPSTPDKFREGRERTGALCGAKYAERFNLRASNPRAVEYLS